MPSGDEGEHKTKMRTEHHGQMKQLAHRGGRSNSGQWQSQRQQSEHELQIEMTMWITVFRFSILITV
jgi:hypothetical protein